MEKQKVVELAKTIEAYNKKINENNSLANKELGRKEEILARMEAIKTKYAETYGVKLENEKSIDDEFNRVYSEYSEQVEKISKVFDAIEKKDFNTANYILGIKPETSESQSKINEIAENARPQGFRIPDETEEQKNNLGQQFKVTADAGQEVTEEPKQASTQEVNQGVSEQPVAQEEVKPIQSSLNIHSSFSLDDTPAQTVAEQPKAEEEQHNPVHDFSHIFSEEEPAKTEDTSSAFDFQKYVGGTRFSLD